MKMQSRRHQNAPNMAQVLATGTEEIEKKRIPEWLEPATAKQNKHKIHHHNHFAKAQHQIYRGATLYYYLLYLFIFHAQTLVSGLSFRGLMI
jgi:hypothetical protein